MSAKKFFVPLEELPQFYKFLNLTGHDVDQIDNATLEKEWENYCSIKIQAGEA